MITPPEVRRTSAAAPGLAATLPLPKYETLGPPDEWVDRYGDFLLRLASVRIGDLATAEDVVQETLLAAWKGRRRFAGECEPRTWMASILKRKVADHWRRNGRRREATAEESEPLAAPPARCATEAAEFWELVSRCTAGLPEHLARVFRSRTYADKPLAALCDAEGISKKNLSVRLHRARALLRQCLERKWFAD